MAERLVAADASPLIGLAAARAFHLLRAAVIGRLTSGRPGVYLFWHALGFRPQGAGPLRRPLLFEGSNALPESQLPDPIPNSNIRKPVLW